MNQLDYALANEAEVLAFLKSKYPLYHLSNVFFRDIQYGIQTFFYRKKMSLGYSDAERIARAFVAQLEKKKMLNPIDHQSWVLNYPEFKKPAVPPTAPAKPAAKPVGSAPASTGSAAATSAPAKTPLPPISRPAGGVASSMPGGMPPLNRPPAGSHTTKPTGLPPLKSSSTPTPVSQLTAAANQQNSPSANEGTAPGVAQSEALTPPPAPDSAAQIEKTPLPPLHNAKPAEQKKS